MFCILFLSVENGSISELLSTRYSTIFLENNSTDSELYFPYEKVEDSYRYIPRYLFRYSEKTTYILMKISYKNISNVELFFL